MTDEQWSTIWKYVEAWRGADSLGGTIADAMLDLKAQLAASEAHNKALSAQLAACEAAREK